MPKNALFVSQQEKATGRLSGLERIFYITSVLLVRPMKRRPVRKHMAAEALCGSITAYYRVGGSAEPVGRG